MLPCPRCQRTNPDEAVFCRFHGTELRSVRGVAGGAALARLPSPFVFPSGRRCETFDELAEGCQAEWNTARTLLQQGAFTQFLAGAGRMDVVQAAKRAQAQDDPDRALHAFITSLPADHVQEPRLDLRPRRLVLGPVAAGDKRQAQLTVTNQGRGVLQGTLTVTVGGKWLHVDGVSAATPLPFQAAHQKHVQLQVDTQGLTAAQSHLASLTVITNGGIVEVPVALDVVARPFPHAPFRGAANPRALAERMRADPKAAWPLLEKGEVAKWFAANGWTYPVVGPPAKGIAAVQQLFEAMGLAMPPYVALSHTEVHLRCTYPERIRSQVTLVASSRKWVYAQVGSDVPWMAAAAEQVSGPQRAVIEWEIDASRLEPDQGYEGHLRVVANAGQQLAVQVNVLVARPEVSLVRRFLRPVLAAALTGMFLRLLLAVPGDLYARVLAPALASEAPDRLSAGSPRSWLLSLVVDIGPARARPVGSPVMWLESPLTEAGFVKHFVVATWWVGAVGGAYLLWRRGNQPADVPLGAIAGAGGGMMTAATLACCLAVVDGVPRSLFQLAAGTGMQTGAGGGWLWTLTWIAVASLTWALIGAALGLLLIGAGKPGQHVLSCLQTGLARIFRRCGLHRLARQLV